MARPSEGGGGAAAAITVLLLLPAAPPPLPPFPKNPEKFQPYQRAKMDTIRSLLTVKPAPPSKDATDILESQFEAQTTRLRDIHKAQRPKNTTKQYKPKQKEWEEWCARLPGNTDGAWVTEDKLCLFLEQEVINRESRAAGYQQRKAKRKAVWKESERAKKRRSRVVKGEESEESAEAEEEEWDEEALDAQFTETVRFEVINSYVSAITELYSWQFSGKAQPARLRGTKLSAVLKSVRRDEEKVRQANYVDRGLFTITSGYDIKGLKRLISWCWEDAHKAPGSVEAHLRTAADQLLGKFMFVCLFVCLYIYIYLNSSPPPRCLPSHLTTYPLTCLFTCRLCHRYSG